MPYEISRRDVIKGAIAIAAMTSAPALAQGEELVPWTDIPENYNPAPATGPHFLDTRTIQKSSFITPNDDFFAVQHYGPMEVDTSTFKLRVSGLVNKPIELTLDELSFGVIDRSIRFGITAAHSRPPTRPSPN